MAGPLDLMRPSGSDLVPRYSMQLRSYSTAKLLVDTEEVYSTILVKYGEVLTEDSCAREQYALGPTSARVFNRAQSTSSAQSYEL